jgi:hypothetical protein
MAQTNPTRAQAARRACRASGCECFVGRDEHDGQALIGGAFDRVAGSTSSSVSMKAAFSGALSRNLSNVPSDPLVKGLGGNIRAVGPNDGA